MENIVIDRRGTDLVLSTSGIRMVCRYTQGAISARQVARRIATSPPLIALVSVGLRLRLAALPGNRSALAPQVGGSIVPIQYGLNRRSISLMVGVGTVLSLVSLPLWWRIFAGW